MSFDGICIFFDRLQLCEVRIRSFDFWGSLFMENFLFSVNVVMPMFLMLFFGFIARRMKLIDDDFINKGNKLCFRAIFPVMLFYNIYKTNLGDAFSPRLLIFAIATTVLAFGLTMLIFPVFVKDRKKVGVMVQAAYRSNFLLFGLPMATLILGERASGTALTLIAIMVPIFNALAVFVLSYYSQDADKVDYKKLLFDIAKNPLIVSTLIGICWSLLALPLPSFLDKAMGNIAAVSTPFALMMLGGQFTIASSLKNMKYILTSCAVRLLIVPGVALTAAALLGFKDVEIVALLAMTASPVAVSSYNMAYYFGLDHELAGELVVMTTGLCIFTIFIFILILKSLALI